MLFTRRHTLLATWSLGAMMRSMAAQMGALLCDPKHGRKAAVLALLVEVVLTTLIILRVPYTEIDWVAYMQEVEGVVDQGDFDYANLKGDTGPLVYPGGFVWFFAILRGLTDGGRNILRAQFIFQGIYLLNLMVVLLIYLRPRSVPPYVLLLLCVSRRVHSIYVLRLFNDCVAMLFAHAAILLLLDGRRDGLASIAFSMAVSIKMNVLLFAPAFGLVLARRGGYRHLFGCLAGMLAWQAAVGAPFVLLGDAVNYIRGSFDFGRQFMFKWTVNLKFLGEDLFLDKRVAAGLLAAHVAVLALFFLCRWLRPSDGGLLGFISRHVGGTSAAECSPHYVLDVLFISNFIGVAFARSLHYQFYCWYWFSLPWLLWQATAIPTVLRFALLAAIELCWNVFPATPWSSGLLCASHAVILVALFARQQPVSTSSAKKDQ